MGRFIVKNVNFFLVFMLMTTILLIMASSLYYEKRFSDLSLEHVNALERTKNAEKYQELYIEALKSLNSTSKSIQFYDKLYENKTVELESTKTTLNNQIYKLNEEKVIIEDDLLRTQESLDNRIGELDDAKETIIGLNTRVNQLNSDLLNMTQKYDDMKDQRDTWNNQANLYKIAKNRCEDLHPGCSD